MDHYACFIKKWIPLIRSLHADNLLVLDRSFNNTNTTTRKQSFVMPTFNEPDDDTIDAPWLTKDQLEMKRKQGNEQFDQSHHSSMYDAMHSDSKTTSGISTPSRSRQLVHSHDEDDDDPDLYGTDDEDVDTSKLMSRASSHPTEDSLDDEMEASKDLGEDLVDDLVLDIPQDVILDAEDTAKIEQLKSTTLHDDDKKKTGNSESSNQKQDDQQPEEDGGLGANIEFGLGDGFSFW